MITYTLVLLVSLLNSQDRLEIYEERYDRSYSSIGICRNAILDPTVLEWTRERVESFRDISGYEVKCEIES